MYNKIVINFVDNKQKLFQKEFIEVRIAIELSLKC